MPYPASGSPTANFHMLKKYGILPFPASWSPTANFRILEKYGILPFPIAFGYGSPRQEFASQIDERRQTCLPRNEFAWMVYHEKGQVRNLSFFVVRHKEFESLTFGSVGSQNHCFLGPFRIKNLHIIMLILSKFQPIRTSFVYFLSFLILSVNKSQQLKPKVKNSKILHVY